MSAKRILVPTDFSDVSFVALEYAVYMANRLNTGIDLLHVADKNELKEKAETRSAYKLHITEVSNKLEKIKNTSGAAFRIETHLVISKEPASKEIIRFSKENEPDLACIGTYGNDSSPAKFHLGNNTDKLVHEAEFPVLTCRKKREPMQFRDLLLPIDLTRHTTEKVDRIIRFAQSFESTIHLLAASEFFEQIISSKSELEERLEEAAATIRKNGLKCTTETIRHDYVSHSVLEYAEEIDVDLLVVMSRPENMLNQLLGSRINKVISHAEIPVLSFRPSE